MPAWGDLVNALQLRGLAVDQAQKDIALTDLKTQILADRVQGERKFNEALARLDMAKQAANNVDQAVPADLAPFANSAMGKPIVQGYQSERQDAQLKRELARQAYAANLPDRAQAYEAQARLADDEARKWYQQGLTLQKEQRDHMASIVGSYNPDGSNLQEVVDAVNSVDPQKLRGAQFDRDANGNIAPGNRTTAAFENIGKQEMTYAQQQAAKREADKLKQEAITNERKDREERERERRDNATIAHLQAGTKKLLESGSSSEFGGKVGDLLGALAERGVALPTGFRSKAQMQETLKGVLRRNPTLSVDEIADKIKAGSLDFKAESKEVTVAAGRAGQIQVAANEVDEFAKLVEASSKKVPRTQFVPFNKLLQMTQSAISSPELREYRTNMMALANAYDVLAARGGTDMQKREENRKNFDTADSPEALAAALKALKDEAAGASRAAAKAMKPISGGTAQPERRVTKDGRILEKKADGTIVEVKQ